MKKSVFFLMIIVILFSACEKIIDINVPDKDRKIVMNSLVNPGDPFSVQLSRSKSVLEDNSMAFLTDAIVQVLNGDNLMGTMEYMDNGMYKLDNTLPVIGEKYRIEVEHPLLQDVYSEAVIPLSVPIMEVDTARSVDEYGYPKYNVNIRFKDPGIGDSYFAISILVKERIFDWENETFLDSTQTYNTYLWMSSFGGNNIGEDLLEQQPYFYMDDKLFIHDAPIIGADGILELGLGYNIFSFMQDTVEIELRLDHIDPSYYKYGRSKEAYYRTNESPFAEPVKVFNNIEGGFGIFSSFARSIATYKLQTSGDR